MVPHLARHSNVVTMVTCLLVTLPTQMQNSTYLEILLLHIRCFIQAFRSPLSHLMRPIQFQSTKNSLIHSNIIRVRMRHNTVSSL
uniref:Secreted protein n=1 Tax=Arundo donax TaxID=35708 RepID=A0A0A9DXV3_ARUDO